MFLLRRWKENKNEDRACLCHYVYYHDRLRFRIPRKKSHTVKILHLWIQISKDGIGRKIKYNFKENTMYSKKAKLNCLRLRRSLHIDVLRNGQIRTVRSKNSSTLFHERVDLHTPKGFRNTHVFLFLHEPDLRNFAVKLNSLKPATDDYKWWRSSPPHTHTHTQIFQRPQGAPPCGPRISSGLGEINTARASHVQQVYITLAT